MHGRHVDSLCLSCEYWLRVRHVQSTVSDAGDAMMTKTTVPTLVGIQIPKE